MDKLTRHPDFMKLWLGQTVSEFGSQVTTVALPLTAAIFLKANAVQMGILTALATLPFLLIALAAGAFVDRLRRRPLLIAADAVRFLLLASVPLLWWTHQLNMGDLYGVQFLAGVMTVLFDLAYQSYLPSLISRERLVDGNSKLETTRAASQIAGPALGSALVQAMAAPLALFADALSYLASVLSLIWIKSREPVPAPQAGPHVGREIRAGLAFVFTRRVLWSLAGCTGTSNFFSSLAGSVYVLYFIHTLHFRGALVGVVFAAGAAGGLAGAVLVSRISRRFTLGTTLMAAIALASLPQMLVPLAPAASTLSLAVLIFAQASLSFGAVVYNINQVSLRQALTPDSLLGRVNASVRFLVWGTMPLGSLAGGLVGSIVGLRDALWVAALGGLLALTWLLTPAVRRLKSIPATPVFAPSEPTAG